MDWSKYLREGNIIVVPGGPVDHENADDFESRLIPSVEEASSQGGSLIIDLCNVDYMTSIGLRSLVVAAKKAESVSVNILVTGMNETMREIFRISGFETLFVVHINLESALAATSDS